MAQRNTNKTNAVNQIYSDLASIFDQAKYDFMPVVTKPITQHNGIEIQGTFRFQDTSSERIPPMCYVTVRRNPTDPYPHNGFGFAFGKMKYTEVTSGIYNIYLVDNSPLINEVFLYNEMIMQENGVNNFLSAGSRELINNTNYRFKLRINEYNSSKLWIVGGTTTEDSIDLDTGLSDSQYYPSGHASANVSGYVVTMPSRYYAYEPQASGYNFGIGVLGTKQGQWYFDDVKIHSIIPNYPFAYFYLKIPSNIVGTTKPALLEWEGYGTWGDAPYTNSSGIQMWLQDSGGNWEKIGEHTWYPGGAITGRKISKQISNISSYDNGLGYCNAYVTTLSAHSKSKLYTDYIHLSSVIPSGIHTGNMLDVYVKDTSKISRATVSGIGSTINLNASSLGPIIAVRTVTNYNTEMIPGDPDIGYLVTSSLPETAFSTDDVINVTFGSSTNAVIEYLYYTDGPALQTFVDSSSLRYPGVDILVKVMPPTIITIENLEYSGSTDVDTMQSKVVDYINSLESEFNVSKLLLHMQSQGATAFNLDSISITVEQYNYKRELLYKGPVTTAYNLTDTGMFYTDLQEVYGVVRV